ncbi:hypothetical protein [Cognatishimia sp. MH4019]|uniref:hypothetical protein n=1 Tax=Cognatishimia sp. MH4019 TaxID=2854030 RepID=UPI001CD2ABC9|nr:hypothetical protein [Cognatishimia sp. MH4019]
MRLSLIALGLLAPLPAFALTCEYTVECFEEEACQPTDFTIDIIPGDLDTLEGVTSGLAELRDVAGTQGAHYVSTDDFTVVENRATGDDTLFRIVIGPEGVSRYQVLILEGPLAVTYHGQCTETD